MKRWRRRTDGNFELLDVPRPIATPGHLLVRVHRSLLSLDPRERVIRPDEEGDPSASERIRRALERLRARRVVEMIETDDADVAPSLPIEVPPAIVGTVVEIGHGTEPFRVGDRVVAIGAHAEWCRVSARDAARIPENVSDEAAVFAAHGAAVLDAVQPLAPSIGETFLVVGLSLVGIVAVGILRAHGCRVFAVDMDPDRLAVVERFGATTFDLRSEQDLVPAARRFARGRGYDGAVVATATPLVEPIELAVSLCRRRGRLLLLGPWDGVLPDRAFREKEIAFFTSDPSRLGNGIGRQLEIALDLIAEQRFDIDSLAGERVPLHDLRRRAEATPDETDSLAAIIVYADDSVEDEEPPALSTERAISIAEECRAGVLGAGRFARETILPILDELDVPIVAIASERGESAAEAARSFQIDTATTDPNVLLSDPGVSTVFVLTPTHRHAEFVIAALEAEKHVYVAPPLCLNTEELRRIEETAARLFGVHLVVGFHRRFSSHAVAIRDALAEIDMPKHLTMTVRVPPRSADDPVFDRERGGGILLGEGSVYFDLFRYLVGAPIVAADAHCLGNEPLDTVTATLSFRDGSVATLHFLSNAGVERRSERLEIACDGKTLRLDDFTELEASGWKRFRPPKTKDRDDGDVAAIRAFVNAIRLGGPSPIPLDEIVDVMRSALTASHWPPPNRIEEPPLE